MNIRQELKELSARVFGGSFEELIRNSPAEKESDGWEELESSYQVAKLTLGTAMNEAQTLELAGLETQYQAQQTYAAQYSFYCGFYAGFEQFFKQDSSSENSFQRLVVDGLLKTPGMERHITFHKRSDQCLDIIFRLSEALGDEYDEHMASVEGAWEEQIFSAAHISFYCGYRAALAVQEQVRPLCGGNMTRHILLTEYELGLTLPLSQRELHSA